MFDAYLINIMRMLGNNIKKCRKDKKISVRMLSEKTNICEEKLKKIEEGMFTEINEELIMKIAESLNVSKKELTENMSCFFMLDT